MEEYLLQHNVTLTDFWTFVALWIIGAAFITFLWVKSIPYTFELPEGTKFRR